MILIGSQAAKAINRLPTWRAGKCSDYDLIGTEEELDRLVNIYDKMDLLVKGSLTESNKFPGKFKFETKFSKFEFDATDNPSNNMFLSLDDNTTLSLCDELKFVVPSMATLLLIKRSHINYPINWPKNFRDYVFFSKELGLCGWFPYEKDWESTFSREQMALYEQLKKEAFERYNHLQDKIKLKQDEEKFFKKSASVRKYVHDDLHRAISYYHDNPMFEQCKTDPNSPLLSEKKFRELSWPDQWRLFQEEAMVIGIERFYLPEKSLTPEKVFRMGASKLLHTMCKGWFQDFGIDHIPFRQKPEWNFIDMFEKALSEGRIREQ